MSSFKAKLFINDEERNLLFVEQEVKKYADITGKPNGKSGMPNVLRFAVESTRDDSFLYHNVVSPNNMIDGEIVFYKRDGFSILFKMEFANAHILSLREEFDHDNSLPLHMFLEIGWGIMRYKGVIIEKYWNPNNPWKEVKATTLDEGEPTFLGYFFEDENGKEIAEEDIEADKKIALVIETENAEGKSVKVDLNNDKLNFKYNGKVLEDDVLKGVSITSEQTRVELLTVIEE